MITRLRFCLGVSSFVLSVICFCAALPAQVSLKTATLGASSEIQPNLTCGPTPCRLPNVQVSKGSKTKVTSANLAINPNNSLQMITGAEDTNCPSQGAAYRTNDGGTSWTKSCLPLLDPIYVDGVPQLLYDNSGVVHALVTLFNLDDGDDPTYETHSTDNGATWSPLTLAAAPVDVTAGLDSAVVDNNSASPFANTIYASVEQYLDSLTVQITVSKSTDGGANWSRAVAATLPKTRGLFSEGFSHLAIGNDGTLYLSVMATPNGSSSPNNMKFVKSTDGGVTWSNPRLVFSATAVSAIPNTSVFVGDSPVIAVDNSGGPFAGRLYMTFYNWTGTFMQVLVTHSSDGGATWSAPVSAAPISATHDQFQSWISVSPTGLVGITWLDRRDDAGNLKYRTYAAFSNDGGVTWGQNIPLTGALSQPMYGMNVATNNWLGSTLYSVWPGTGASGGLNVVLGGYAQ